MLLTISVTVIAAVMLGLVIFLVPVLLQVRRTAREAEKVLEIVRMQIVPVGHDLTLISSEVNGILQSIHRQVEGVEDSVATVRDATERLREFEEGVLRRFEAPLFALAAVVSGISRGIETFFRILLR
jgi:uncharacterized protein YoxC